MTDNNHSHFAFQCNGDEILKLTSNGFYVRGQKLNIDDQEAETVYLAFKQWLTWAQLQK